MRVAPTPMRGWRHIDVAVVYRKDAGIEVQGDLTHICTEPFAGKW